VVLRRVFERARAGVNRLRLGLPALAMIACAARPLDLPLAVSDLATTDMGGVSDVPDLAVAPLDLASPIAPPDLASPIVPPDLALPDLKIPPPPPDLTVVADLSPPPICATTTVSTIAGNGNDAFADGSGGANGTAEFNLPIGVHFDGAGNIIVGDQLNNRIRKIAPDGTTSTLAGNGLGGFADGSGATAELYGPCGITLDGAGNIYVADRQNLRIRVVAPDGTTSTLAGNGNWGYVDGSGGANGTTEFSLPEGVAVDGAGNVYVADFANNRVRKVAPDGTTTTLTGNGTRGFVNGSGGANGTTELSFPEGIAIDGAGNLYVADAGNNCIRKVAPDGTTTTLAGNGTQGFIDGAGDVAEFNEPIALVVDDAGNVYVGDTYNFSVRKIAPDGTTVTIAGTNTAGFVDGTGCGVRFNTIGGLALAGKVLIVSDAGNNRIRKLQLP
jgi:sugar lactone lactonase YvrE